MGLHRFIVGAIVLGVIVACDGAPEPDVAVEMSEWSIHLSHDPVTTGDLSFDIVNDGVLLHELLVVRTSDSPDSLPVRAGVVELSAIDGEIIGEVGEVTSGDSLDADLALDPGTYVLFCNIPGHYLAGMHTTLAVSPDN